MTSGICVSETGHGAMRMEEEPGSEDRAGGESKTIIRSVGVVDQRARGPFFTTRPF